MLRSQLEFARKSDVISSEFARKSDVISFRHRMASHLRQLVPRSAGVAVVLLALCTPLAVNAATPAHLPRPNGPGSRVPRGIPCTDQALEAVEPLWITASERDLLVPVSSPGAAGFPSFTLGPTYSGIVAGGFFVTHNQLTVFPPAHPRGPPLVSRYPLI